MNQTQRNYTISKIVTMASKTLATISAESQADNIAYQRTLPDITSEMILVEAKVPKKLRDKILIAQEEKGACSLTSGMYNSTDNPILHGLGIVQANKVLKDKQAAASPLIYKKDFPEMPFIDGLSQPNSVFGATRLQQVKVIFIKVAAVIDELMLGSADGAKAALSEMAKFLKQL